MDLQHHAARFGNYSWAHWVLAQNKLLRGNNVKPNGGFRMWDDPSQTIHQPRKKKVTFVSQKRRTGT
jgi:hypothetical protein